MTLNILIDRSAYMPYLTLWDKISQNLAHLEATSHKIFQISQNFHTIFQHILWWNKHKSHFVVFITSFLHLNKGFWQFLGKLQNFICLISQISVHSLWHVSYTVWAAGANIADPEGLATKFAIQLAHISIKSFTLVRMVVLPKRYQWYLFFTYNQH